MPVFLLKLETEDGRPAEPAELHAPYRTGELGTRSIWASARFESWPCETSTEMHLPCWCRADDVTGSKGRARPGA